MVVYKATSLTSGKSYIGKTTNSLEQRKNEHIRKSKSSRHTNYFHKAIKKYGANDFIWEIIYVGNDENDLNSFETHFINEYDTYNNGYNMSLGGEGQSGYKYTTEHSKKMSDSMKLAYKEGRKKSVFENMSDDTIKKIRKGASDWAKENTMGESNSMWGKGKKIMIENKIYNTMREAATDLGVHKKTIQYRLNSDNYKNYKRL